MRPNYSKIYHDLITTQYPEKMNCPKVREQLEKLDSTEEIIKLNKRLFSKTDKETEKNNQQLKTYDRKTMMKLLSYQQKHNLSTSYMSRKYKISRTTFTKWKRTLEEEVLAKAKH